MLGRHFLPEVEGGDEFADRRVLHGGVGVSAPEGFDGLRAKRGVDGATIKSAALGSYMMKLDDGLQFRVERLK